MLTVTTGGPLGWAAALGVTSNADKSEMAVRKAPFTGVRLRLIRRADVRKFYHILRLSRHVEM
jgi:hypothetical protein